MNARQLELERERALRCDADGTCITCSDAAVSMRVESVAGDIGVCLDDSGTRSEVMLSLVPDVRPGARVLVHAGVALLVVQADDAARSSENGGAAA